MLSFECRVVNAGRDFWSFGDERFGFDFDEHFRIDERGNFDHR
jgi:hypothetical protein